MRTAVYFMNKQTPFVWKQPIIIIITIIAMIMPSNEHMHTYAARWNCDSSSDWRRATDRSEGACLLLFSTFSLFIASMILLRVCVCVFECICECCIGSLSLLNFAYTFAKAFLKQSLHHWCFNFYYYLTFGTRLKYEFFSTCVFFISQIVLIYQILSVCLFIFLFFIHFCFYVFILLLIYV